ncbi:MAG: undecaprenyl-diphosphate phosphatase [Coriobacteriales bacterium]|jgi:undecaprenyl-diphosphatase|nr:undecaprenyl-diphosphate phosphatase [Coriobacteriales bacterium]
MEWLELLKAAFIGLVEGITEWLPVSSTGHMILVDEFIKLNVSSDFKSLFLVVIQLGAIMAVIILYFQRLNPWSRKKTDFERRDTWSLWGKVIVACIPAAIIGVLFDGWVTDNIVNKSVVGAVVVATALIVYGIAFIIIEAWQTRKQGNQPIGRHSKFADRKVSSGFADAEGKTLSVTLRSEQSKSLTFKRALAVGFFQCLSIIPGTSRSGATIIGARILGISKKDAAEFSFFLAIPVMFGWSALKVVKTFFIDSISLSSTEWAVLAVGVLVSLLVSIVGIRFLMNFIQRHSFAAFGWYRIILGIVVIVYFAIVWFTSTTPAA